MTVEMAKRGQLRITNNTIGLLALIFLGINLFTIYQNLPGSIHETLGNDVATISFCVNEQPHLSISCPCTGHCETRHEYRCTAFATDSDSSNLTFWDNTTLFDIDPVSGVFYFTPTFEDVGNYSILISVTDHSICSSNVSTWVLNLSIYNETYIDESYAKGKGILDMTPYTYTPPEVEEDMQTADITTYPLVIQEVILDKPSKPVDVNLAGFRRLFLIIHKGDVFTLYLGQEDYHTLSVTELSAAITSMTFASENPQTFSLASRQKEEIDADHDGQTDLILTLYQLDSKEGIIEIRHGGGYQEYYTRRVKDTRISFAPRQLVLTTSPGQPTTSTLSITNGGPTRKRLGIDIPHEGFSTKSRVIELDPGESKKIPITYIGNPDLITGKIFIRGLLYEDYIPVIAQVSYPKDIFLSLLDVQKDNETSTIKYRVVTESSGKFDIRIMVRNLKNEVIAEERYTVSKGRVEIEKSIRFQTPAEGEAILVARLGDISNLAQKSMFVRLPKESQAEAPLPMSHGSLLSFILLVILVGMSYGLIRMKTHSYLPHRDILLTLHRESGALEGFTLLREHLIHKEIIDYDDLFSHLRKLIVRSAGRKNTPIHAASFLIKPKHPSTHLSEQAKLLKRNISHLLSSHPSLTAWGGYRTALERYCEALSGGAMEKASASYHRAQSKLDTVLLKGDKAGVHEMRDALVLAESFTATGALFLLSLYDEFSKGYERLNDFGTQKEKEKALRLLHEVHSIVKGF